MSTDVMTSTTSTAAAADYYIPASSSPSEHLPRTLKHGDTFAVFDHYGDVVEGAHSSQGVYHHDTRHLSRLALTLYGERLLLLSSNVSLDNALLAVELANPDMYRDGRVVLSRETLHLSRAKFLWQGSCYERLALHNFDSAPHRLRLGVAFAADFVDLFEVRGAERSRRGTLRSERSGDAGVVLRYLGLDGLERTTRIDFDPAPTTLSDSAATYDLTLAPGRRQTLLITIRCNGAEPARPGAFFPGYRDARRAQRALTRAAAVVDCSNPLLNQVLCRSAADLYMLTTDTPHGPYPYAGIPWFSTAFGRDGIITALEMLWFDPSIARGVLNYLAATQARDWDPANAAEPGKILHETRGGEMARLGEVPFGRYYGTVDATPLFVLLAGRYYERTGDRATLEALWPNIEAALAWMDGPGDQDGDGFIEYRGHDGKGLSNQGWKDSADSISHADGSLADGPIALCEVQAYAYAARLAAAAICRALGHAARAATLEDQAAELAARFETAFWCEELGTYAMALDGDKRACQVRSSNAGHALFAGIAGPASAERVAATLLDTGSFSGWGIRTLATSERRYNPMSYHNGSVWPHDNALIALGLARYGFKTAAVRVFSGLFDAIKSMDLLRPPELFCGFPRRGIRTPTLYPVACSPQAWASAAPLALLEACLGLKCDHARGELRFDRPVLPEEIDEVRIRRLSLGGGHVDVLLRRYPDGVAVNVLQRSGGIRVVVLE
jgi:glycogen debranching enzyme